MVVLLVVGVAPQLMQFTLATQLTIGSHWNMVNVPPSSTGVFLVHLYTVAPAPIVSVTTFPAQLVYCTLFVLPSLVIE